MRNRWADAFLLESEDLIAQIEECGLALSDGDSSPELIGQLFRAFHTIKGSGAMVGLDRVASFTHHIETLLDDVREGRVPVSPRLAELVLASVDQIKALIAAEQSESPEEISSDELIASLRELSVSVGTQPEASASSLQKKTPAPVGDAGDPSLNESKDERRWKIVFNASRDLFRFGGSPLPLFRELRGLGVIESLAQTQAIPPLEEIHPESCYLGWEIILRSAADETDIREVFIFVEDGAELTIVPLPATSEVQAQAAAPDGAAAQAPAPANESRTVPREEKVSKPQASLATVRPVGKESVVRVPSSRLDRLVNLVGELVMNQSRLAQAALLANTPELANPVQEIERLVAELRDDVLGIRMLPIGTIFGRFRRLVHDLSNELGKEVELVTEGAETELDKSILDQLGEPLVHLLRNSIDHGIEPAQDREQAGKPPRGTIRLSAAHMGSNVVISIEDDGKGISRDAVRAKAIQRKLISPDAVLTDKELFNLILLPGFSTAKQITNVSGRGVGMDVVKKQIETLRGSLSITSENGKGTKIALSLPLTLAIIEGLIVQLGDDQFIIPMSAITENVELDRAQRERKNGRNVVEVRGELVPYIDLRAAFHVQGNPPLVEKVVIVRHEEERVGLVVDRVLGTHQTVLQSLGRFFRGIHVVSGATILGDGRVALILDISATVQHVQRQNQLLTTHS